MYKMMHFYVLVMWLLTGSSYSLVLESADKCTILFKEIPDDNDFKELKKYNLSLLNKITQRTYTFKYTNDDLSFNETIAVVKHKLRDKVAELENVKEYLDVIEADPTTKLFSKQNPEDESVSYGRQSRGAIHVFPADPYVNNLASSEYIISVSAVGQNGSILIKALNSSSVLTSGLHDGNTLTANSMTNLVCNEYYGMGIEDAWANGYTGKGVVVAVTDVGINKDLEDLRPNINDTLSVNLIHNTMNVTPEYFYSYREVFSTTDHGNRCASLIAAVKGNNICSAGIAYNATIAVVKISEVTVNHFHHFQTLSTSDTRARSQIHGMDSIDIYSNSWAPSEEFDRLTFDMKEALKTSAEEGRKGRGAIHVFPAGPYVNDLANSEYIITVSAVGQNGSIPTEALICSSVLTSGLHDGNTLTAKSMVTTSYGNQCVRKFSGVSAATAQIAGIIALGLEANPDLTRADVEDLIVHSSESTRLVEAKNFIMNAAGLKFHRVFGFGLLNASVFVKNAANRKIRVGVSSRTLQATNYSTDEDNAYIAKFYYNCSSGEGFHNVTKAKIRLKYTTSATELRMTLISPGRTESILQDLKSDRIDTKGSQREQILTSVHFWDEKAFGLWTFIVRSNGVSNVNEISLTLFEIKAHIGKNKYNVKKPETTPITISNETSQSHGVLVAVLVSGTTVFIISVVALLGYYRYKKRSKRGAYPVVCYKSTSCNEQQIPILKKLQTLH